MMLNFLLIKKIIFGLGNPVKELSKTNHNIGMKYIIDFKPDNKNLISHQGFDFYIINDTVLCYSNRLMMNDSGSLLSQILNLFSNTQKVCILYDDYDLLSETFKINLKNAIINSTHNGIRNIKSFFQQKKFIYWYFIRIGIKDNSNLSVCELVHKPFKYNNQIDIHIKCCLWKFINLI